MAKGKNKNAEGQAAEAEDEQKGGMTEEKIGLFAKAIDALKAKMDKFRGELGAEMKQFEEEGGNKAAFKVALKISNMESSKAQDFWRSLVHYMRVLKVFDQHDLFDKFPGGEDDKKAMPAAPKVPQAEGRTVQ